jgi:hypothetical protein
LKVDDPTAYWRHWLSNLRDAISLLIDGLDYVSGPGVGLGVWRAKGALAEINGYPGLAVLAFGLECAAKRGSGKFTVHCKHGEKGTLIRERGHSRHLAWSSLAMDEAFEDAENTIGMVAVAAYLQKSLS